MNPSPDKAYGPIVARLMQKYCEAIADESGATGVRISCEFVYKKGNEGILKLKTFTTPDAKTERMLDPDTPLPRGSKLQRDAVDKLHSVFSHLTKNIGGK